ncbi:hypothetical protein ACFL3S_03050 [Gemmatimonadota bacterium]
MRPLRSNLLLFLTVGALSAPQPSQAQETRVLLVVGLGGDPEYRELFLGRALEFTSAMEGLGVPRGNIVYLGERPDDAPEAIQARSTKENVASVLAGMAGEAETGDRILVVLIGHGTSQGGEARFNLPGPDLTPADLDVMLGAFPAQTVAVVNTTPASGPFLAALSGAGRVILTATRSAQERNETQFGGYFVEALADEGSDLDKDGRISLLEAFDYARREVERYYETRNLLATEHPVLDDDGDGEGSADPGADGPDGSLARTFWLGGGRRERGVLGEVPEGINDPELRGLYLEKADLERRVAELRALKSQMEESRYEQELEDLLVALALKNREIREKGGGE